MNPSGQLSLILRTPSKAIQAPNTSTQWSFSTQSAASLVLLASPLVDTSADQCRLPSLQPPLRSTPPPSANDSRRTRPERSLSLLFPPPRGRYEMVIPPEKVSCMHACPWCPAVVVTFPRSVLWCVRQRRLWRWGGASEWWYGGGGGGGSTPVLPLPPLSASLWGGSLIT